MFDIQMFAEGESSPEAQTTTTENTESQETAENPTEKKSEVDIDAKISEAMSKMQKSFEETLEKRDAERKKEEERLSKLSDDERQKAEIENGRKKLELKEKELQHKELMLEMTKVMAERNLPVEFTEYLIADTNESTLERIKTFEKKFKAAIEAGVNERLKGKTPPSGSGNKTLPNIQNIKDGFMKMISANQVKRG